MVPGKGANLLFIIHAVLCEFRLPRISQIAYPPGLSSHATEPSPLFMSLLSAVLVANAV